MILIFILSALSLLIGCYLIVNWLTFKWRKKETSDWMVNDLISIIGNNNLVKVLGWSKDALFIESGKNVEKISWSKFSFNKSVAWRRNFNGCKDYMGTKKPGFGPKLDEDAVSSHKVEGKPVELLSEIECQIYLKKAIEEENYELADSIRKQMEKYR
jgi:hypothetical protein